MAVTRDPCIGTQSRLLWCLYTIMYDRQHCSQSSALQPVLSSPLHDATVTLNWLPIGRRFASSTALKLDHFTGCTTREKRVFPAAAAHGPRWHNRQVMAAQSLTAFWRYLESRLLLYTFNFQCLCFQPSFFHVLPFPWCYAIYEFILVYADTHQFSWWW